MKFKVWDSDKKKFVKTKNNAQEFFFLINSEGSLIQCFDVFGTKNEKAFDYAMSQYSAILSTGKTDKNGVELFDGDIIKAHIISDGVKTMGAIVYDNYLSMYSNKNDAGLTPLYKLSRFEKIGSKFENPKLIEKNKGTKNGI